jgi:cell division protein FtsA
MEYVASLDMGSETMVMALAEVSGNRRRAVAVEQVPSRGIERGKVTDVELAMDAVGSLLDAFRDKHGIDIDRLRVALPATWLKRSVIEKSTSFAPAREITDAHLAALRKQCREALPDEVRDIVAILPTYTVDGEIQRDPAGKPARRLTARCAFYLAREAEITATREWLARLRVERVDFYPAAEAMGSALAGKQGDCRDFALVDLGAGSTKVVVFQGGVIVHDAELPLGSRAIDWDLHAAFSIPLDAARELKHEYGMAMRVMEKNRKIIIPNTQYRVELHALAHAEQCRLEELLEGAVFQVQRGGYHDRLHDGILLTGGGSRVKGVETLMMKLSGHRVRKAVAVNLSETEGKLLQTPEYLTALGLLSCASKESGQGKRGFLGNLLGNLFN